MNEAGLPGLEMAQLQPLLAANSLQLAQDSEIHYFRAVPNQSAGGGDAAVSASEANRFFSRMLRQVAQGKRFTVHSHGRPVATIALAETTAPSRAVARQALLTRL
jgi:hypothetical protein